MTIRVVPDTYATIPLAYAAAVAGDTIYLKESGSPYKELVVPTKANLLFEGENLNVIWKSKYVASLAIVAANLEAKTLHFQNDGLASCIELSASASNYNFHNCKFTGDLDTANIIKGGAFVAAGKVNDNTFYGNFLNGVLSPYTGGISEIKRNTFHGGGATASIFTNVINAGGSLIIEDNVLNSIGTSAAYGTGILISGSIAAGTELQIKNNTLIGSQIGSFGAGYGIKVPTTNTGTKTITGNIVKGWFSQYPIYAGNGCSGLTAYWNDFYNGILTKQGYDYNGANTWDNGADKGNYWGYGGEAYDTNGDAIGDNPYELDKHGGTPQDNYPLMCSIAIHPDCPYLALKKKWCLGRVGVRFVKL